MMTDIVERLRFEAFDAVNWDGETMKQWDKIREQAETLPGSDLPRLMFQGLIESLAELMVESAFEIERLRNDAQSAWQPIETAPRDGSPIEVCNTRLPMLPPVIVRWLDELSNPDTGWCDAATASGDALYYNANYFDFWKPTTALPSAEREGATPSAPDASAPAQRPRE